MSEVMHVASCRHCGWDIVRVQNEDGSGEWLHEGVFRRRYCLGGETTAGPPNFAPVITGQVSVSGNDSKD